MSHEEVPSVHFITSSTPSAPVSVTQSKISSHVSASHSRHTQPLSHSAGPPPYASSQSVRKQPNANPNPADSIPTAPEPVSGAVFVPSPVWMPVPPNSSIPPNCPAGLEVLALSDHLFVYQEVEIFEALTGCETNNKYFVKNSRGEKLFSALELNGCCNLNCIGVLRSFDIQVSNFMLQEAMHVRRDFACQSCCFPSCLQTFPTMASRGSTQTSLFFMRQVSKHQLLAEDYDLAYSRKCTNIADLNNLIWLALQKVEISAPPGKPIGHIIQEWSFCHPKFRIENADNETILQIKGPACTTSCCGGTVDFTILSADGLTEVGRISKLWSGMLKELLTDADNFGIAFPLDMDVNVKACLLGACLLIDFMYFERSGKCRHR